MQTLEERYGADLPKQDAIYHACRVAFVACEDGVPWHMVCHALRQGLGLKDCMTYTLKEKDLQLYPDLQELMDWLKRARLVSTAGQVSP